MVAPRFRSPGFVVAVLVLLIGVPGVGRFLSAGRLAAEPAKDSKTTDDIPALRKARVALAEKGYRGTLEGLGQTRRFGNVLAPVYKPADVYAWSVRWLQAQRELSPKHEDQVAALEAHLQRMTKLQEVVKQLHRDLMPASTADEAEWYRLEAQLWLAKAKQAKAR